MQLELRLLPNARPASRVALVVFGVSLWRREQFGATFVFLAHRYKVSVLGTRWPIDQDAVVRGANRLGTELVVRRTRKRGERCFIMTHSVTSVSLAETLMIYVQ